MASRFLSRSILNITTGVCRLNLIKQQPKFATISILNANQRMFSVSSMHSVMAESNNSSVYTELNTFLNQEIKIEKEARKQTGQITQMKNFEVKGDGPNVTLSKKYGEET